MSFERKAFFSARGRMSPTLIFFLLQPCVFSSSIAQTQEATEAAQVATEAAAAEVAAESSASEGDAASLQQVLTERGWEVKSTAPDGSVIVTLPQAAVAPSQEEQEEQPAPQPETDAAGLEQVLAERGWEVKSTGPDGAVIVRLPQTALASIPSPCPQPDTEAYVTLKVPEKDLKNLGTLLQAQGWSVREEVQTIIRLSPPGTP